MDNRVDFNKLRKRRQRGQSAKRILALFIVMIVIIAIIIINNFLVNSGATTVLSDAVESFGGNGYPVQIPGGIIHDVKSFGNDIAVINDTNLYIYNKNGKIISNIQQMGEKTEAIITPSRLFIYNIGGNSYSIHSSSRTLVKKETTASLLSADMNLRGDYVIITSSPQYLAQLIVYNNKSQQIFEWLYSDSVISDVSLNSKGEFLVASSMNSRNGEIYSKIHLLDLSQSQVISEFELIDEMVLKVHYLEGDEVFSVLTDKNFRTYDKTGKQLGQYKMDGSEIVQVERRGKNTTLLLKSINDNSKKIVLLNYLCETTAEMQIEVSIKDIAMTDREIYTLTDKGITEFNSKLEKVKSYDKRGVTKIQSVKNRLYYFNKEEINLLGG